MSTLWLYSTHSTCVHAPVHSRPPPPPSRPLSNEDTTQHEDGNTTGQDKVMSCHVEDGDMDMTQDTTRTWTRRNTRHNEDTDTTRQGQDMTRTQHNRDTTQHETRQGHRHDTTETRHNMSHDEDTDMTQRGHNTTRTQHDARMGT